MAGIIWFLIVMFFVFRVVNANNQKNKKGGTATQSNTQTSQNPTPQQPNPAKRPTVTPMQRPAPNMGGSPAPRREENRPKYYDSTCMEANSRHDHDRRLEQLEGFLKDGVIDKEEYRILVYKYQQRQ